MTEPEEPQDREWLAGMVAAFLCGARGMTQLKPWPEVAQRLVAWLADRQLLADPEQGSELAPGCRVFLRKHPEDQVFGTVMRPWRGAKGDRGWFVQWDGGDEEAELDEDLADAHLVECGRDWTRVTRAAGLIADDTPDDVVAAIEQLQARIDKATALAEQHITFGPVPSPAANVCRQLHAALQPAPVHPGQDATLGPRHPAGSPEGHFPIRPQSTGQHYKDTPPILPGDETPQPEEDQP